MSKKFPSHSRRRFIKLSLFGLTAAPLGMLIHDDLHVAGAAELPQLDENDAMAQSFGYKHDASQVDVDKFPKRKEPDGAGQFCSNCQLYTGGEGSQWGPCSIFPGKGVNADGWCNAWIAKSS